MTRCTGKCGLCGDSLCAPVVSHDLEWLLTVHVHHLAPAKCLSPKPRNQKLPAEPYCAKFHTWYLDTCDSTAPEGESILSLTVAFWLLKLCSKLLITGNLI